MAEIFNPKQIFEIAAKIKENGSRLYEILERNAGDEELKAMWASLRKYESIHQKVFQEMTASADEYIVYEMSASEYNPYLREIIPNYRHTQEVTAKKIRELFSSPLEAVEHSIYVKIESILAYSALKEYILPVKLDMLNKITGDEKRFLAQLTSLKKHLKE